MINAEDIDELKQLVSQPVNEEQAYNRLYHIYFTPLLKFAISLVHLSTIAEEIVSDVLLQLWHIRKDINSINNLTFYLYACIKNQSLNYLRSKNAIPKINTDDLGVEIISPQMNPEEVVISEETYRMLESAVSTLPPKCRMIFRMIREEGLKYREVASLLNISQKTVEAQMGIAMKKLSEALHQSRKVKHPTVLSIV